MTTLLENSKNYIFKTIDQSSSIEFPVYILNEEPLIIDGLVFVEGKVVDDRNIDRPTLGARRLVTTQKCRRLHKACLNIVDLLKRAKTPIVWCIDRYGNIIKYRKTRLEPLVSHRIKKVLYQDYYSLLLLEGINFAIEVPRPPIGSYAQILYYKGWPWRLYDITAEEVPKTKKKV